MAHINIFKGNAFSTVSLTTAVERAPFKPSLLGNLPIWNVKRSRTKAVSIETRNGALKVIQTSPRGADLERNQREQREMIYVEAPRIAEKDRVTADEIQDIRAFGSETELMQVQQEVANRLSGPVGLQSQVELTWENMRLGAVQGVVKDADGSTLINWYQRLGITPPAVMNFDIGTPADVEEGAFREQCTQVVRAVARGMQLATPVGMPVYGLAGDEYWDKMMRIPECRESFKYQEGRQLREGVAFGMFDYGGITFVNYRGTDDGDNLNAPSVGIAPDEVSFFPGSPAAFEVAFAPGESFEWVNTPGKDLYVMVIWDEKRNQFVDIEVYSYPLFICTRPAALRKGKIGAGA